MKNQKFKVANATVSRLLQEELFKQGYAWGINGNNIANENHPYIYTYEDGLITHGDTPYHFDEHKNEEVRVITENKLVIAELQALRPKVIVFGKTYYKDDFDAAVAQLEVARV
jgi:hypothetical protein